MNAIKLKLLLLLTLVAVAIAVFVMVGRSDTQTYQTQFLPEFNDALAKADTIVISNAADQTAVKLTVNKQGGEWTVSQRGGYLAEMAPMRKILTDLAQAKVLEKKTDNPQYFSKLELTDLQDKNSKAIGLQVSAKGEELLNVLFGKRAFVGGTNGRYVRLSSEQQTWLIDGNYVLAQEPASWLNKDVLNLDSNRVQRMVVTHPYSDAIVSSRETAQQTEYTVANIPVGRELLYSTIGGSALNAVKHLQLKDVYPQQDKTLDPNKVIVAQFYCFDGLVIVLTAERQEKVYFATLQAYYSAEQADKYAAQNVKNIDAKAEAQRLTAQFAGWVYKIDPYKYQAMSKTFTDMLKPLAEPAAPVVSPTTALEAPEAQ